MRLCGYGNPNIVFAGSNRPKAAFRERQLSANSCLSSATDIAQKRTFAGDSYRPKAAGSE
jgi:hypothetical protein